VRTPERVSGRIHSAIQLGEDPLDLEHSPEQEKRVGQRILMWRKSVFAGRGGCFQTGAKRPGRTGFRISPLKP